MSGIWGECQERISNIKGLGRQLLTLHPQNAVDFIDAFLTRPRDFNAGSGGMKLIPVSIFCILLAGCCEPSGRGCDNTITPEQAKAMKCNEGGPTRAQFDACMRR